MRILIIGVSASGKTTFARKIAEKINAPLFLMDQIMWLPGWNYIGDEETVEKINEIIVKDEWILEGYIAKAARVEVFDRADLILYLDYPGWLSAWRYLKRTLKHRKNPRPELPGSPESFSFKFLKLVYTKGETWKVEKLLKEHDWDNKITRFKNPKEAELYLNSK